MMSTRRGAQLVHSRPGRSDVACHLALPADPGPATRLVVVLHGTERNSLDYREPWWEWAREHDRLVVCPHFDRAGWPGAPGYILGNVLDPHGRPRPERAWAFRAVTDLAAQVADTFGLADRRFDLWGHSAGAQFVHRYALFQPAAPLRRAIAANAGWYTLPESTPFPYGIAHPVVGSASAARWTAAPLVLMRGELDVERDATLRVTPGADLQGPHRFARAASMIRAGRAADPHCRWELHDVPGVGHQFAGMAAAAQALLLQRT